MIKGGKVLANYTDDDPKVAVMMARVEAEQHLAKRKKKKGVNQTAGIPTQRLGSSIG